MKIGPNHESAPLNRPDQESAKRTQEKSEQGNSKLGASGNLEPQPVEQPKDTLHLSGLSGPSSERIGYDSQELRDQLAAARMLREEQPVDVGASGKLDKIKLDEIRQLVQSGFYESEEVRQQIADKLTDEFIGD